MSNAAALTHVSSGKVREIYASGEERLLLVASDRISTYDVVHPTPIPDKGKLLTGLTAFWLDQTADIVPNHLVSYTDVPEQHRGRSMLMGDDSGDLEHVDSLEVRGRSAQVVIWTAR